MTTSGILLRSIALLVVASALVLVVSPGGAAALPEWDGPAAWTGASPRAVSYPDVPPSHPFHDEIAWLSESGTGGGFTDGTFRPTARVSRQTMAAFLQRLWAGAGETSLHLGPPAFADVGPEHPFADEIGWMDSLNIASGYADGSFRPGEPVTRQAMAAFLRRLWTVMSPREPDRPVSPGFPDVPADHPFRSQIRWMDSMGITSGYPDGTFRPTEPVSRQAMAAFLQRFWQRVGFVVDVPADTHDADVGDGLCADASDACSIRAAADEANALSGEDRILMMPGLEISLSLEGRGDDANVSGDLDLIGTTIVAGYGSGVDAGELDRVLDARNGALRIHRLEVTGGHALLEDGGGIRSSGRADLTELWVHHNEAEGLLPVGDGPEVPVRGGGIFSTNFSLFFVVDSLISDNAVVGVGEGGGLAAVGTEAYVMRSALVHNAVAGRGGGAYLEAGFLADVTDSTVSSNTAVPVEGRAGSGSGSGVQFGSTGGRLFYVTAVGNDGLSTMAGLQELAGTIIHESVGADCSAPVAVSRGYNLVSDASCGLSAAGDEEGLDPQLGPLADNGGPTPSHLPALTSPAVDAIPPGTLRLCANPSTDQRGIPRALVLGCDIGSVTVTVAA